jgi:hypothetical protein
MPIVTVTVRQPKSSAFKPGVLESIHAAAGGGRILHA